MLLKFTPQALLVAYLVRLLLTGACVGDALALFALVGLYAFFEYIELKKQVPINKDALERITLLETKYSEANNKLTALTLNRQTTAVKR